jgi:hypothetical protein
MHDGHCGSGLADNHTADKIGDGSAKDMSDVAEEHFKLIRSRPKSGERTRPAASPLSEKSQTAVHGDEPG